MTIQVDASQVGLGAVLLQNNKPIAFASKALAKTEHCNANIERCLLSSSELKDSELTSAVEPLPSSQTISPWNPSPRRTWQTCGVAWLHHMLLQLQSYDYVIHYHPSKEMALPDTLSCFSPCPGPEIPLDIAIHHAHLSPDWKEAFHQAFMSDPEMHALTDIIITSWPDDIKAVPCPLHPYWQHHEMLTIENGLVLCGEALIVPPSERECYTNYTSSIKESPKPSCSCVDVSSGLV